MKKEEYTSPFMKVFLLSAKRPLLQVSLGNTANADDLDAPASTVEMDW